MTILVTGSAGFIGMHVVQQLLARGEQVVGVDNMNTYYEVSLKEARLKRITGHPAFRQITLDVADGEAVMQLFAREKFTHVIHLAAQAGVRYSLEDPHAFVESNITGFLTILEACRVHPVAHLVYASSSSVYGANTLMPYAETHTADHSVSFYGATKKANEVMAHCYSHLFAIPSTGLRFFTVYGPWGRPDMAYFKFARAIMRGEPIDVYNHGKMRRDFTYVDDIVTGILGAMDRVPKPVSPAEQSSENSAAAPYRIYNIGNHVTVELMHMIEVLEQHLGKRAEKRMLPMQAGDVVATWADVGALARDVGFTPATSIEEGLKRFAEWFKTYYDGRS